MFIYAHFLDKITGGDPKKVKKVNVNLVNSWGGGLTFLTLLDLYKQSLISVGNFFIPITCNVCQTRFWTLFFDIPRQGFSGL